MPLSLEAAGVYHRLNRNDTGGYDAASEPRDWRAFFSIYQIVHWLPGQSLYAYSAVFSPSGFELSVVHEWQRYDETGGAWETAGRVVLPIVGGRSGGFRTYSFKRAINPGLWRVNVETTAGQIIGRIKFRVVVADSLPPLETLVL